MAIALLVLGVPIIDAFWIIVRRLANRRLPFSPDRGTSTTACSTWCSPHYNGAAPFYGICASLRVPRRFVGQSQLYAFGGLIVVFGLGLFALAHGETHDALEADLRGDLSGSTG